MHNFKSSISPTAQGNVQFAEISLSLLDLVSRRVAVVSVNRLCYPTHDDFGRWLEVKQV